MIISNKYMMVLLCSWYFPWVASRPASINHVPVKEVVAVDSVARSETDFKIFASKRNPETKKIFNDAQAAYTNENYTKALNLTNEYLEKEKDNPYKTGKGILLRAEIYTDIGKLKIADVNKRQLAYFYPTCWQSVETCCLMSVCCLCAPCIFPCIYSSRKKAFLGFLEERERLRQVYYTKAIKDFVWVIENGLFENNKRKRRGLPSYRLPLPLYRQRELPPRQVCRWI